MRTTIDICSFLTALLIVNSCIFATNRKMQRYNERYEQLVQGQNPTNNISTVYDDLIGKLNTPLISQWNDENGTFFLKNVRHGYVVYHCFADDEFIPFFGRDTVAISNSNQILMKMHWTDEEQLKKYDGKYLEFLYRGMKYFIIVFFKDNAPFQIFGNKTTPNSKPNCSWATISESAFHFKNAFEQQTYMSKWKIGNNDDEWIKVFRDDNNDICLQFMKDKS